MKESTCGIILYGVKIYAIKLLANGGDTMLDSEIQQKIAKNNQQISELLRENEELLRQAGYNPPVKNFTLPQNEQIQFPSGYIRTVYGFNEKYHLNAIFPYRHSRHNVIYALEVSDLMNFVFNRINIWGPVKTVFYKLAIVNLVSIMEAIILEAANNICKNASHCAKTKKCLKHFSNTERNNARKALEKLVLIDVLDYNEHKLARLQEIMDLRNRIHIRLAPGSELQLDNFNLELYNETIQFLQDLDNQIFEKGVPLYGCAAE